MTAPLVDVPDAIIVWKPTRNRRSPHWPMPNGCDDLASFEVLRHLDLPGLGDDALRDQLVIARHLLGAVLVRSGSPLAEVWLRERIAAIGDEVRERQAPAHRDPRRDSGYRGHRVGPPPSLLDRLQGGSPASRRS